MWHDSGNNLPGRGKWDRHRGIKNDEMVKLKMHFFLLFNAFFCISWRENNNAFIQSFRTTKNVKYESQHHSDSFSLPYHLSSTIPLPWIVKTRERNLTPSSLLLCHTVPFFLFIHTSERNWSSYIHMYTYYYIRSIPIKGEEEGYSRRWFSSFFYPRILFDEERVKRGFVWRKYLFVLRSFH